MATMTKIQEGENNYQADFNSSKFESIKALYSDLILDKLNDNIYPHGFYQGNIPISSEPQSLPESLEKEINKSINKPIEKSIKEPIEEMINPMINPMADPIIKPANKPVKCKPISNVEKMRGFRPVSFIVDDGKLEKRQYTKTKSFDQKVWPNIAFISIDKLGFELEGAWIYPRNDIHDDLSFHKDDFPVKYNAVGEFVSKPIDSYSESIDLLRKNWPDVSCNKCGFHIHFSLKSPALYALCMSRDFYDFFLNRFEKWGKINIPDENDIFWARLNGLNKYCKKDFIPDEQASWNEKGHNRLNRRTQLNYCWQNTGTIECRLFPMFDNVEMAISVVTELIHIIEDFTKEKVLESTEKKELVKIIDNPSIIYHPVSLNMTGYKCKNKGLKPRY